MDTPSPAALHEAVLDWYDDHARELPWRGVQATPWSVDENTCRPTVRGRDSTELVMISGLRKLFQWWLIDTSA